MQIVICDDEKEIRDLLAEKIRRIYPEAVLLFYPSGEALLLSCCQPDILLLDIQMPGKDGMETAREFRRSHQNTILIFVTAFEDYVFQAFDVGAFHYLVKPFENRKFEEVLKNAAGEIEERKHKEAERAKEIEKAKEAERAKVIERTKEAEKVKEAASLIVTAGGKHIKVNLEDIIYAEVFDRKVILHTLHEDIEYYGKMKELEKKAGDDFYRSHRAYLVNFNYVRKYNAAAIYLETGRARMANHTGQMTNRIGNMTNHIESMAEKNNLVCVPMAKQNYREFVKRYLHFNQRKV